MALKVMFALENIGVPQNEGYLSGVHIIRTIVFGGSILGPIYGSYSMQRA